MSGWGRSTERGGGPAFTPCPEQSKAKQSVCVCVCVCVSLRHSATLCILYISNHTFRNCSSIMGWVRRRARIIGDPSKYHGGYVNKWLSHLSPSPRTGNIGDPQTKVRIAHPSGVAWQKFRGSSRFPKPVCKSVLTSVTEHVPAV